MNGKLTLLCCLSLLLSLISLSLTLYSSFNSSPDNYSFLVSVLTFLVTMLIGWQIYNAVEINKKVDNINKVAERAAYNENKLYNHTTKAVVYYITAIDYDKRNNDTAKAIDGLFNCINEALYGKFQFPIEMAMDYLLAMDKEDFFIYHGKKEEYKRILYNINNEKSESLIKKIQNAYEH